MKAIEVAGLDKFFKLKGKPVQALDGVSFAVGSLGFGDDVSGP